MKGLLTNILLLFNVLSVAGAQTTPPWTYVVTGSSHTIIVTTGIHPNIGGVALSNGDYVGVFYDAGGTWTCGGYEKWTGSSNISISAFGDDAMTAEKDGFATNELMRWKIWRSSDGKVFIGSPGYAAAGSMGGVVTNTDRYIANGISALSALSGGIVLVDGDLTDPAYTIVAGKLNSNQGLGAGIDVSKIVYYPDVANSQLYIGVAGKVDVTANHGIGLWLDFNQITGLSAGTPLGGSPGSHYMGETGHNSFKADFEVDYMFAINPGSTSTTVYVDIVKLVGSRSAASLGSCGQAGLTSEGPPGGATLFSPLTTAFAFNNDGGLNHGFEIRIPFDQLGVTGAGLLKAFAFAVQSDALFSDVTVPGNQVSGNPGYGPDFGSLAGGPYHGSDLALPVQLTLFSAKMLPSGQVALAWTTMSEVNNYGFEIERRKGGDSNYKTLPNSFIPGHGTTMTQQRYAYVDANAIPGLLSYRLKQLDLDGTIHYSDAVQVNVLTGVASNDVPESFFLSQNHPNPFNPTTTISFDLPTEARVRLVVYDLVGREVARLAEGSLSPGHHSRVFDASRLASGVYLYCLQASGSSTPGGDVSTGSTWSLVQTKKLILAR